MVVENTKWPDNFPGGREKGQEAPLTGVCVAEERGEGHSLTESAVLNVTLEAFDLFGKGIQLLGICAAHEAL